MIFEYSFWWIIPIVVIAFAVAYLKFRKLSQLPEIPKGVILLISTLRFLAIFTLLFLLLNPVLHLYRKIAEKPVLIIAQDNSLSVIKTKDSLYYMNEYRESLAPAIGQLNEKFEIVPLVFGKSVRKSDVVDFSENYSDISAVFDYAEKNFSFKRPAGMVLLTDGIYNNGVNPRYQMTSFPVYTVALGDTTRYPDIYIRSLDADKFNFINTIFPIKTEIGAGKQKGTDITCFLKENGKIIAERIINIDSDNYLTDITFEVEAKRKGIVNYTISVDPGDNESVLDNNTAETWINIIDNSADIAIFYSAPHPDVAAIVNAVNISELYRCNQYTFDNIPDTLTANLLILHNPDPNHPSFRKLEEIVNRRKISVWYILTNRKSIIDFANLKNDYSVTFSTELNEYATIGYNNNFSYFELMPEEIKGYEAYPPLVVPFGEIKTRTGKTLFYQKIKNTSTSNGIINFYDKAGKRTCYLLGDGLWRWKFYSYKEKGSHELFNILINKIVGYLSINRGTERFVHDIKPLYGETEDAVINVELYNDSYELVNIPDVKMELKYNGKDYDYVFGRNGDKYRINLGNLPAGEYHYKLSTDLRGEAFNKQGSFYVRSQNIELNNLVADNRLLEEIADNSGGKAFKLPDFNKLVQFLHKDSKSQLVYRNEMKYIELTEVKILGLILLLLLCIEWFLIKYFAE